MKTEQEIVKHHRELATLELLAKIRAKPEFAALAVKDGILKRDSCFADAWARYQKEFPVDEETE